MDKLSIYIADDHAIVVDGLKEILRAQPNWQIIGTAGNGQELVDLISARRSDVVILLSLIHI